MTTPLPGYDYHALKYGFFCLYAPFEVLGTEKNPANEDHYRRVLQALFSLKSPQGRRAKRLHHMKNPNHGSTLRYEPKP